MAGADAGHAARKNLAAFLHELGKNVGALVVDQIDLFDTKLADFFLTEKLALAAARAAGTASWATRSTAFTAWSAAGATFAASTTTAVPAMTTVSATWPAGAAFAARRRTGRRCGCRSLRSCWCLILFV